MTVRWKPLIVLSALFLVVGVMGVVAITYALMPGKSADLLALARADAKAGHYEKSQIQFRRALQVAPKDAAIHAEMAAMLKAWADAQPAQRAALRPQWIAALTGAARYDKKDAASRRALLADFLDGDETAEAAHWATEVMALRPDDVDSHFAHGVEDLMESPPKVAEARNHLAKLIELTEAADRAPRGLVAIGAQTIQGDEAEAAKMRTPKEDAEAVRLGKAPSMIPASPRVAWLLAEVSRRSDDDATMEAVLAKFRGAGSKRAADGSALDRLSLLRLQLMDVHETTDLASLADRVGAFRETAGAMAAGDLAPNRVATLGRMLEAVQRQLSLAGSRNDAAKVKTTEMGRSLDTVAEAIYKKSVDPAVPPDLRIYQAYAEHLLFRERRTECMEVASRAIKSPMASLPAWAPVAMQLRETAIKAALLDANDPRRHDLAAPFIKGMIDSPTPRYQGLGHLFQGVIDLEKTGLAAEANRPVGGAPAAKADPKVRASALAHLKVAAANLPDAPAPQALYGIALLLSDESAIGRQYLQAALRLGTLEPRYRIWAAWSVLQAGYPEEAQPIVETMLSDVEAGRLPADLAGSLHLLKGELHQAKRTAEDSKIARAEYEKAIAAGQPSTPAMQLRLAQLDVLLGDAEGGRRRIEALRTDAKGGATAERMGVLLLRQQGHDDEARKALVEARKKYPADDDLVALAAAYLVGDKKPAEAERALADFLASYPDHVEITMLRARLLAAPPINKVDEARQVLSAACERAETSAPAVQLALLEIGQQRFDAAEVAINRVRSRWKESAAGDLLMAQLRIARNDPRAAIAELALALKKDPSNKLALFWKAQLEDRSGGASEAAKVYEEIARDNPVKEVDSGLTLATAARWALATQALENLDYDAAIGKFETLLQGTQTGEVARLARWRMAQARAAKGDWKAAKAEVDALLDGPDVPVSDRVQGANLYRLHHEDELARRQLNLVLKQDAGHSQAAAVAAYLMADQRRPSDSAAILRRAMAAKPQPPSIYLMLAAIENLTPPKADGLTRALAVIDEGLAHHADSVDLVRAKSRVTRLATEKADDAIAIVEARAKSDAKDGRFRRLLVDVLREEDRTDRAEAVLRTLQADFPDDPTLMVTLVRAVSTQAIQAARKGDRAAEKDRNDETARLLAKFRAARPREVGLIEAECDLCARRGDLTRARTLTEQIDAVDPNSAVGALLRAKIAEFKGDAEGAVIAYDEAVARAPRRLEIRVASARADLAAGKVDDAVKQADAALTADRDRVDALIVRARALTARPGSAEQAAADRAEAAASLRAAMARLPKNGREAAPLSPMLAEVLIRSGDRAGAVATLRDALKANPADESCVAMLIQVLAEPRDGGPAPQGEVDQAIAAAAAAGNADTRGAVSLAVAVGFHKAGRVDLALPHARKAAALLDSAVAHQDLGDILLTQAESTPDESAARPLFEEASAEYDRVLKAQPTSLEAINNKAWILHRHLGKNAEALGLVESFLKSTDPAALPAEFQDTLGAIREAAGRPRDAEAAYERGLKKSSDHPVLNYHMGKLLARDPARKAQAGRYLEKALASKARLAPPMADDAQALLRQIGG